MKISRGKILIITEKTRVTTTGHSFMRITDKTLARKDIQNSMETVVEMVIVITFLGEAMTSNTEMATGTVTVMGALVIKRSIPEIARAISTGTIIGAATGETVIVTHILGDTMVIHTETNTVTIARTLVIAIRLLGIVMTIQTRTTRGDITRTKVIAICLRETAMTIGSEMMRGGITTAICLQEYVMVTNAETMTDIQVTIIIRGRDIVSMREDTMKKDVMTGFKWFINKNTET